MTKATPLLAIEALEQEAVEANDAFLLRDDVITQIGQTK